jgi:hypothetical protein
MVGDLMKPLALTILLASPTGSFASQCVESLPFCTSGVSQIRLNPSETAMGCRAAIGMQARRLREYLLGNGRCEALRAH